MVRKAIIFIDGSNFYHNIKKVGLKSGWIDFKKLCEFICAKFNLEHKKTIFYSSIPSIADGEKTYYDQMKFLNSVENIPKFEVKTRKLQRLSAEELIGKQEDIIKKLKLCSKCLPEVRKGFIESIGKVQIKEKGLDVQLSVDMVSSAVKKECDACIVISGDADFIPAMDLAKEFGLHIISAFVDCDGYSREIRKTQQFMYLTRDILIECMKDDKKQLHGF